MNNDKGLLALGLSAIALVLIRALLVIALVLGGAYALTTYVELPGIVDTLVWIAAGGYALLSVFGAIVFLTALGSAANSSLSPRRRRRY